MLYPKGQERLITKTVYKWSTCIVYWIILPWSILIFCLSFWWIYEYHQDHGGMNTHHSHQEFKGNCMYFRILIFPCKLIILNGQYDWIIWRTRRSEKETKYNNVFVRFSMWSSYKMNMDIFFLHCYSSLLSNLTMVEMICLR
jgi:hypothetical protein